MKIVTLEDAFLYGLADIYNAERQLERALPKCARAAKHERLTELFEMHMQETEQQIKRICRIVESQQLKLPRAKCKVMEALVEENNMIISNIRLSSVRDVMLVMQGQKIEHYEIASYMCLIEIADKLGFTDAAKQLADTLQEETAIKQQLKKIVIFDDNSAQRAA